MIRLAFLSLVRRPLRQFLLFLLIVVTCALPVFILQMAGGLYGGINRAVSPFPILAGAKGSAYQLVLNTVFLRDRPVGNIPYEEMERSVPVKRNLIYILYCERGASSLMAAKHLARQGYQVKTAVGGILAYRGRYLERQEITEN